MLLDVWPGRNFWFYLAIISSPSWVFSFLAMDFIKKTSGLVFIFLILTLTLSCFASNLLLYKLYFSLRRNPETNHFFGGYECAGKTTGFVLVAMGSVGLSYFSEKSVACLLTFLFLAFYRLCTLLCIQPCTGFGVVEFLLTSSLNPTLRRFGLRSVYSWLVIITCIVIIGIRYRLQPKHLHEQATRGEVQLEAGVTLDNINPSPSDIFLEPAPAGGPTTPLLEEEDAPDLIVKRFKHDHELELRNYNKLFKCDGCMEEGFRWRYRCEPCNYELHEECMYPKPMITHQFFRGSTFIFRDKPGNICDACGREIRGYSYHCKADKLDLHPRCSNLKGKLCIGGTNFVLRKKAENNCFWCKKRRPSAENTVEGWCYVSECNKFYCHVYCVSQMVQCD